MSVNLWQKKAHLTKHYSKESQKLESQWSNLDLDKLSRHADSPYPRVIDSK